MEHPPFDFERDTFAFPNELLWEYRFDAAAGKTHFTKRQPTPDYTHRCFVLARAARQFRYHAQFAPDLPRLEDGPELRRRVREVISRDPRKRGEARNRTLFPGYDGLRELSRVHEALLKAECGGAWRSYALRSHWRMVFPISRANQERAAAGLLARLKAGETPIVHLVLFPQLTINHGMVIYAARESADRLAFSAYDPNQPARPAEISFDRESRAFSLPANDYWAGGRLNVIEIYRNWLF